MTSDGAIVSSVATSTEPLTTVKLPGSPGSCTVVCKSYGSAGGVGVVGLHGNGGGARGTPGTAVMLSVSVRFAVLPTTPVTSDATVSPNPWPSTGSVVAS